MSHVSSQTPPTPSDLRLFIPADDDPLPAAAAGSAPDGGWRLSEFFRNYFVQNYLEAKNRRPGTRSIYEQIVRLWAEITGDPPLRAIDQPLCDQFVAALKQRPGLRGPQVSPNTVRRFCVHAQKLIDMAGPKNRHNRTAARILEDIPYFERPDRVAMAPEKDFTLSEIGQWLGACPQARQTENLQGIPAAIWWRSIVIFAYNTGLRIETIMGATWEMVDRRKPGWIQVPPTIYKGRTHGGEFYLNGPARAAIEAVRIDDPQLFPWLHWPASQSWLHEQRRRILAAASISPHRRFGFHGLRAALITWLSQRNWMVAKIVAGHVDRDVTRNHYVNPDVVRDLLDQVPQPRPISPSQPKTE